VRLVGFLILTLIVAMTGAARPDPLPGTIVLETPHGFDALVERTQQAVEHAGLVVVATASASRAAKGRGIDIPGNAVVMAFNNIYAVRMLAANVDAGIEAPIRLYISENPDKTATLSYRPPSLVFAPYAGEDLKAMARELDAVFDGLAKEATGG
jgi:uncharacterized protein (DUF302 family)